MTDLAQDEENNALKVRLWESVVDIGVLAVDAQWLVHAQPLVNRVLLVGLAVVNKTSVIDVNR